MSKSSKPVAKASATPGIQVSAGHALQALAGFKKMLEPLMPATVAFQLARVIARLELNEEVRTLDRVRGKMLEKHGNRVDGGFHVPPEKMAAFIEEYGSFAQSKMYIQVKPLPVSILAHAPEMTAMEMCALEKFFEEE